MEQDAGVRPKELRVDGGASNNSLLMQFQADLLGLPVVRPKETEITALGAAYLAGLAVGYWKNTKEIAALWQRGRSFRPTMDAAQRQACLHGWNKALQRAKGWQDPEA
jgi:glycerol kinase